MDEETIGEADCARVWFAWCLGCLQDTLRACRGQYEKEEPNRKEKGLLLSYRNV